MKKIRLNEHWKLICMEPQDGFPESIESPCLEKGDWMDVKVPGDVNNTMLECGKIPDPYFDTQAREAYWISSKEWWYALKFDVAEAAGKNTDLCMTNVDGNTDVWLNGNYLGETKNAFRLFRFHIAEQLKEHENVLIIRFKSIDRLLGGPRADELGGWKDRRAFLRKPQFSFGWDWALPLPSIGLAGDVWLESDNDCRFTDMSVQPFVSGRVDFSFEVTENARQNGYEISIRLWGHGNDIRHVISRETNRSYKSLHVENPKLWWPNGYGEQPLYNYRAELTVDGQIVDFREGRVGLRESRIVEKPFTEDAGPGYSFRIQINGNPVFCKGGNWIPMEIWPGTIKPDEYGFYLRKAKEANFNMLRVWGGGIYEPDVFYDLCDELGIMVWEDFMFAGAGYPVDTLRDEIISEADYQIRRLRNHPCVVIWCGCNEDVHSWSYKPGIAAAKQQDTGAYSETDKEWAVDRLRDDPQIYTMILRGMVSRFGLEVPYVESSPMSRDDYGNMPNSGNCHISCWKYSLFESDGKYENFRRHFEKVCSFDSEFCIQGPASVKMIRSFLKPENHWPPNDAWIYHIQRGHANLPHYEQTMWIAGAIFGEIDSLQKYVRYGQAAHVEMMRAEFESARRDYPNNGGTMMWMYNDCWPTSNWSIVDYYKNPKPSYYAAKRACAPLLPIIFERSKKIEFLFSNHTQRDVETDFVYGQKTLQGRPVWSRNCKHSIKANESFIFDCMPKNSMDIPRGDFLFIDAVINGEKLQRVIYFANGWKGIEWPSPEITIEVTGQELIKDKWQTKIKIKADDFARMCHILYTGENKDVFFSDNYFDLSKGDEHELCIKSTGKISLKDLRIGHWLTEWE
ncbi:MAG: glycoside hydrolase family 2 protein [Clostridiaceae bacterium]